MTRDDFIIARVNNIKVSVSWRLYQHAMQANIIMLVFTTQIILGDCVVLFQAGVLRSSSTISEA